MELNMDYTRHVYSLYCGWTTALEHRVNLCGTHWRFLA